MFSIGKDVFMKALTGIGKVLSVKGSLPVLGCVRITGAETGATVSATNLEEYIAFNFDSAKVCGDDDVIVELAALKKFLSGAAGGEEMVC